MRNEKKVMPGSTRKEEINWKVEKMSEIKGKVWRKCTTMWKWLDDGWNMSTYWILRFQRNSCMDEMFLCIQNKDGNDGLILEHKYWLVFSSEDEWQPN